MCSKNEFSSFLADADILSVSKVQKELGSKGFSTTFRFKAADGDPYEVRIIHKKKSDLQIKGSFVDLKGIICFEEVRTKDETKLLFGFEGEKPAVEISSEKMISIAYLCAMHPESVPAEAKKQEWLGKPRFTAEMVPVKGSVAKKTNKARLVKVTDPKQVKPKKKSGGHLTLVK